MLCILVNRSILGFERILKQITHMGMIYSIHFRQKRDLMK